MKNQLNSSSLYYVLLPTKNRDASRYAPRFFIPINIINIQHIYPRLLFHIPETMESWLHAYSTDRYTFFPL